MTETSRGLGGAKYWALLNFRGAAAFATEVTLTGRFFTAEEALAAGIINRVAPEGRHLEVAYELAAEVAKNPPLSVRATVRTRRWYMDQLEREVTMQTAPQKLYLSDLTLAAREADIVGFSGITFRRRGAVPDISGWRVSEVDKRMQLVRDVAGDQYSRLELNALVQRVVVTDHPRQAAEELARRWTQLSPEEILESLYVLIGTVDKLIEDLHARRERWGISYYVIFEPYVDAFAPIVARLAGG